MRSGRLWGGVFRWRHGLTASSVLGGEVWPAVLAEVLLLPPSPPRNLPAPCRGAGYLGLCSVIQTGNGSSESPGHRVRATQLRSRVPGCSLQVQALVSCTPTVTHTPAWLLRLWSLRTPLGLGERHRLNNPRKTLNNLSLAMTSVRRTVTRTGGRICSEQPVSLRGS